MTGISIASLHIYPVKGCRGIGLDRAEVRVTGLASAGMRDREWMAVDPLGSFVTQREYPRMALIEVSLGAGRLRLAAPRMEAIELPAQNPTAAQDVTVWRSKVRGYDAGDEAAQWLSTYLNAKLRLVRFDPSKPRRCNPDYVGATGAHTLFADGYPVLVIGQGSLDDLNTRLVAKGEPALPMNRFRPNVVVSGLEPYEEDHLHTLESDGVRLQMVKPCARCQVTTTDQQTARVGFEPLPTLSTYRRDDRLAAVLFGMNAIVTAGDGSMLAAGAPASIEHRF